MRYPIVLYSDIKSKIEVNNKLFIRPITEKELADFFGIKERKLNKNLDLSKAVSKPGTEPFIENNFMLLGNYDPILSSTHIVESTYEREEMGKVGEALKLLQPSKSGILLGYSENLKEMTFFHPNPFCQYFKFATLNERDIKTLHDILEKILSLQDNKFDLVIQKYCTALSGEDISLENRYLELMYILEILLLPDKTNELTYRISLRFAKLFQKYRNANVTDFFRKMHKNGDGFYAIRSKLVHEGKSKHLTFQIFVDLVINVQSLTILYLEDKEIFKEENLEKICIE